MIGFQDRVIGYIEQTFILHINNRNSHMWRTKLGPSRSMNARGSPAWNERERRVYSSKIL